MDNGHNNINDRRNINTQPSQGNPNVRAGAAPQNRTVNSGAPSGQPRIVNGQNQARNAVPGANGNGQRTRPRTEEEMKRLRAASQAAQNSSMSEAEIDRHRAEAAFLQNMQKDSQVRRSPSHTSGVGAMNRSTKRKRNKKRINAGAVIFTVLIIGIVVASVVQLNKNTPTEETLNDTAVYENEDIAEENDSIDESAESDTSASGDDDEIIEDVEADNGSGEVTEADSGITDEKSEETFKTVTVSNDEIDEGLLVLVNYQYSYDRSEEIETKNAYSDRTGRLKVAATDIDMEVEAFAALESLVVGMIEDVDCHELLITSGHRTVAEQQEIWDYYLNLYGEDYVNSYVAVPGYSEHQTGLACDLSFYTDDGESVSVANHQFGYWLGDNCMNYGFIRRYPEDKVDITKISYEAWHFRYVGIPSAYACTALDFCLEEYIDYLKNFSADGKLLCVSTNGEVTEIEASSGLPESGWVIYYTPMADGDSTSIDVPEGYDYIISGNNVDGFITTVTIN